MRLGEALNLYPRDLAFGYHLTDRWTLIAGYGVMDIDYGEGSDPFQLDLTLYGPLIGAAYRF